MAVYKYVANSGNIDITGQWQDYGIYEFDGPDTLLILFGYEGIRPKSIHETGRAVKELLILKRK